MNYYICYLAWLLCHVSINWATYDIGVPFFAILYLQCEYQEQVYFLCILDNGDSNGESRSVANTDQLSDVSLGFCCFFVVVSPANNVSVIDAFLLGLAYYKTWVKNGTDKGCSKPFSLTAIQHLFSKMVIVF